MRYSMESWQKKKDLHVETSPQDVYVTDITKIEIYDIEAMRDSSVLLDRQQLRELASILQEIIQKQERPLFFL
jgi:hypothetical protein